MDAEELDWEASRRARRLDRALRWAAGLTLLACALPVRVEANGPLWLWRILDTPTGRVAALAQLAAGPALFGLTLLGWSRLSRAVAALLVASAAAAAILVDPDASHSLLPNLPAGIQRGGGFFVLGLVFAGAAALWRAEGARSEGPDLAARALALCAVAFTALLYLWPHRTGTLAGSALAGLAFAAARLPASAKVAAAVAMSTAVALVPAALVGLAALRALGPRRPKRANLPWMLAFPAALLVALSMKAAATFATDVLFTTGLRAAALFLAATVLGIHAVHATVEQLLSSPGDEPLARLLALARGRRLALLGAFALLGVLLAWAALRHGPPRAIEWRLGPETEWAHRLYAEDLQEIVFATSRSGGARERAVEQARRNAASVPALAEAIFELGALLGDVGGNRRAIERAGDRLNDAARGASLPYYADVNVMGVRHGFREVRWIFYVKTYRIRRVAVAQEGEASYGVLWLERLDDTNVLEQRMGWKKAQHRYATVILDRVSEHWRGAVAPALAGTVSPDHSPYAEAARFIREDLEAALAQGPLGAEAPALLADHLACSRTEALGAALGLEEEDSDCAALALRVEPAAIEALARMVETHELQHVIDAGELDPPDALVREMAGYSDESIDHAAAELSAYLAEIGRSEQPRMALAHLLAVSRNRRSAEEHAGKVLVSALLKEGEREGQLISLPREELRQRAREAFRALFGAPLPEALTVSPSLRERGGS